MFSSAKKLGLYRTTLSTTVLLGFLSLTGCGAQLHSDSLPQTAASASSSSSNEVVAADEVPEEVREGFEGGSISNSSASASTEPSSSSDQTSAPSDQVTGSESASAAEPSSSSPSTAAAPSPTEDSGPVDLAEYQGKDFNADQPVYQFSGLGLKCNLSEHGASCWRKPVEFTSFPFEGATVGSVFKYRFEALTEGTDETVAAFEALQPKELPAGKTIEYGGSTCTNDGTYINCDSGGYHFQMNATEILPTPDNLK